MNGLFRRPLAVSSALFLLLLFTVLRCGSAYALPLCIGALIAAAITVGVGVWVTKFGSCWRRGLFFCTGLLLAASLAFFSAYRVDRYGLHNLADPYDGKTGEAVLTVTKVESSTSYSTTLLCNLHTFSEQKMELSGRLYLPYAASPTAGDRIALTAELTILSAEGETLAQCYDYSQGIFFEATANEEGYRFLSHDPDAVDSFLSDLRLTLQRSFYPYLSDEDTGLVSALLIGDRSGLSEELSNQFRNLGISHTLAVSGLHLGILCGSLLWILRKLRLPRKLRFPVLLPILLFYMLLVGSPSVYRAGGMTILMLAAYHFGRRQDPITSLLGTVTLICLLSPASVLDVGLLLSFFATFGILLIAVPILERLKPFPKLARSMLSALTVTGAATLFTLPFAVWYFGEWAILSPLANLILVPLVTGLLYLAMLLLLLSPIAPLATLPALLIRLLSALLRAAGSFFGASDHLLLPLDYLAIGWMAAITVVAVFLLCLFRKTRPLILAVGVLFLCAAGGYCTLHAYKLTDQQAFYLYSEENNDCIAVTEGTRVLLIDHSSGGYAFLSSVLRQSEADPLIRVDTLVLTQYHYRQIASITRLLKDGRTEYLILPRPAEDDYNTAHTLANRAAKEGCQVIWYSEEDSCIGYHDAEIHFTFAEWDDYVPRSVTICQNGKRETYALPVE